MKSLHYLDSAEAEEADNAVKGGSVKFCILVSDEQMQFAEQIGAKSFSIWGIIYKKNTFEVSIVWDNLRGLEQNSGGIICWGKNNQIERHQLGEGCTISC